MCTEYVILDIAIVVDIIFFSRQMQRCTYIYLCIYHKIECVFLYLSVSIIERLALACIKIVIQRYSEMIFVILDFNIIRYYVRV